MQTKPVGWGPTEPSAEQLRWVQGWPWIILYRTHSWCCSDSLQGSSQPSYSRFHISVSYWHNFLNTAKELVTEYDFKGQIPNTGRVPLLPSWTAAATLTELIISAGSFQAPHFDISHHTQQSLLLPDYIWAKSFTNKVCWKAAQAHLVLLQHLKTQMKLRPHCLNHSVQQKPVNARQCSLKK